MFTSPGIRSKAFSLKSDMQALWQQFSSKQLKIYFLTIQN